MTVEADFLCPKCKTIGKFADGSCGECALDRLGMPIAITVDYDEIRRQTEEKTVMLIAAWMRKKLLGHTINEAFREKVVEALERGDWKP